MERREREEKEEREKEAHVTPVEFDIGTGDPTPARVAALEAMLTSAKVHRFVTLDCLCASAFWSSSVLTDVRHT